MQNTACGAAWYIALLHNQRQESLGDAASNTPRPAKTLISVNAKQDIRVPVLLFSAIQYGVYDIDQGGMPEDCVRRGMIVEAIVGNEAY